MTTHILVLIEGARPRSITAALACLRGNEGAGAAAAGLAKWGLARSITLGGAQRQGPGSQWSPSIRVSQNLNLHSIRTKSWHVFRKLSRPEHRVHREELHSLRCQCSFIPYSKASAVQRYSYIIDLARRRVVLTFSSKVVLWAELPSERRCCVPDATGTEYYPLLFAQSSDTDSTPTERHHS